MEEPCPLLSESGLRGSDILIFITVGTHNQPFDRLLKAVDELSLDSVIWQTGCSSFIPKTGKYQNFYTQAEFEHLCASADIIISHGGIGSLMTPLMMGKPVIAVPRLSRYHEHTNDHQLQIVEELGRMGKLIPLLDINKLKGTLKRAYEFSPNANPMSEGRINKIVSDYLMNL